MFRYDPREASVSPDADGPRPSPSRDTCWIISDLAGRVLYAGGNLRRFFNLSHRAMIGRDVYVFIDKDREYVHRSTMALTTNVTIERDLVIRPRDRKPVLVRVMIATHPENPSFLWHFSPIS